MRIDRTRQQEVIHLMISFIILLTFQDIVRNFVVLVHHPIETFFYCLKTIVQIQLTWTNICQLSAVSIFFFYYFKTTFFLSPHQLLFYNLDVNATI